MGVIVLWKWFNRIKIGVLENYFFNIFLVVATIMFKCILEDKGVFIRFNLGVGLTINGTRVLILNFRTYIEL